MSRITAHSLAKTVRTVRGHLKETRQRTDGEKWGHCLYWKDGSGALNISHLEEILVVAEAQLAAMQSLKDWENNER